MEDKLKFTIQVLPILDMFWIILKKHMNRNIMFDQVNFSIIN
jgi:hypothetical protein